MQQQLQQLSNTNMPWAAQRAQYALQVGQAVQQGQLSPGEAKEILADLINADKLNQDASDAEMRATLVFGVTQLAMMLG
jgi:polyhydroxyalkanoate synthesis regulator phasin